VDYL
jgi:hypothetical protein